jgi:DNA methylase
VYWWAIDALPSAGAKRTEGLMRPAVKWCVWLGGPDCYRNQDNVLWTPSEELAAHHRSDMALRTRPSGRRFRNSTLAKVAEERGGTTPMNCLPIACGGNAGSGHQHPAITPYDLAAWWCRYVLPPGGVLCDPFCGSGTMLLAGLGHGASKVVGIDKEAKYLRNARGRVEGG